MKKVIFILILIFVSNLIGMYFGMYSHWWFDMVHHFLGGFFVAMLMTYYLTDVKGLRIADYELSPLKKYLVILGAVSFIGVVWEFAEYLANQTLIEPIYKYFQIKTYFMGNLDDTINDLLMDVLGALVWLRLFVRN